MPQTLERDQARDQQPSQPVGTLSLTALRARLKSEAEQLAAKAGQMALEGAKTGAKAGAKAAIAHPAEFAPLAVGAAVVGSAFAADETTYGWPTVIVVIALAGLVLWSHATSRRAGRAVRRWTRRLYESVAAAVAILYTITALVTGPLASFAAELFGWSMLALTLGWWLRDGRRPWKRRAEPEPALEAQVEAESEVEPEVEPEIDPDEARKAELAAAFVQFWGTQIAAVGGPLIDSNLIEIDCDEEADRATIVLSTGRGQTLSNAKSAEIPIAAKRGIAAALVTIEPLEDRREDRARVSVYREMPLRTPRLFTGPEIDFEKGLVRAGTYADRRPACVRWWMPGSGTWCEMVSGTTGSGKSRYVDQALATERHARNPVNGRPLVVSWAGDPQEGQSLPDWQDGVLDRFAPDVHGSVELLEDFYAEMMRRSHMLARLKWPDEKGRTRTGISFYDPIFLAKLGIDMPILALTLEEAHAIFKVDRAVERAEDLVKMIRKCGGRLRVVTQVPSMTELGSSLVLRPLLASMNVICLRTADAITDNVFNLPGDPSKLPAVYSDDSSTAGSGYVGGGDMRPALMRLDYVEDPYDWATTGETAHLPTTIHISAPTGGAPDQAEAGAETAAATAGQAGGDDVDGADPQDATPGEPTEQAAEGPELATARVIIGGLLDKHGKALTSGMLAAEGGLQPSTVSTTCRRMEADGQVVKLAHGLWDRPGRDTTAYWSEDPSVA